jgi:nitrous oxidase accessory protein
VTARFLVRAGAGVAAAMLVWLAAAQPLWTMTLRAPQYPKGLRIEAYGTGMAGDLKELNILNHYIGMKPLDPAPPLETKLFPIGIAALIVLCLASPVHRWLRRAAVFATLAMPLGILADLQWWLYTYGHSLNPKAPIRLPAFTPLVLGSSSMGNFHSTTMISIGILCLAGAAVILIAGERLSRRLAQRISPAAAAALSVLVFAGALQAADRAVNTAPAINLQRLIDAAPRGSTVTVPAGHYAGPIAIRGPLTVDGVGIPVIDGGGQGSVVTIEGDGVTLRGFAIRNSGRSVTEEAAGITARGSRHRIERNDLRAVYFGIHVEGGAGHVIAHNVIAPGVTHGARPGHGISLWHTTDSHVEGNRITEARDGVYLSFTRGVIVSANDVSGCRYGLHSMYSEQAAFIGNRVSKNLLGSALMNSDRLELRGNRIEQHRQGAAAYGILLKDIGDLIAEDNIIVANRIGLYAEGVPDRPSRRAILRHNLFAGNEAGVALQSNASLIFTANRLTDNLTDVRPLGAHLSPGIRWSLDGVGNSWGQYRGYDRNGDGVGDLAHQMDDTADALMRRDATARAFLYTPAHLALEAAARMFPLLRRPPLLVDAYPLMPGAGWRSR